VQIEQCLIIRWLTCAIDITQARSQGGGAKGALPSPRNKLLAFARQYNL